MCIKKIVSTGFLLFLISGAVISSGCMGNAQNISGMKNESGSNDISRENLDIDYELVFMKDILNEMKSQGKDISSPLETYRIARMQAKNGDIDNFKKSLSVFYEQCNTIMVEIPENRVINNKINL